MKLIPHLSVELWDLVVSRSDYATFFHTSAWANVLVDTYAEFRVATRGVVLDDGTPVIVPMLATTERNGYFKWYESMFPGGYGGAIAERNLTPAEVNAIYQGLLNPATAYIHVMGNPLTNQDLPPSYTRSELCTHVLRLDVGFDSVFANYRAGHKYSTKKARKTGVVVGVAEKEEEFEAYYSVYQDSLRRWGGSTLVTYPFDLFQNIYRCRSEKMKLWVATINGQIISGCLVFYHNRHALYWHAATREDYLNYGAGPLLITEILRDACQRGLSYYDFSPSGQLKGVEGYKEGFGAQKVPFHSYVWQQNRFYRAYQHLRGVLKGRPSERPPAGPLVGSTALEEASPTWEQIKG